MIDAFNSHLERDWYFTTFQEDSGLRTAVTFITFFLATIFGFFAKRLGSMARRSLRSETYAYMVLRGLATVVVVIVGLWAGYIILQQEVL
jgi:hypothetical protein